MLVLLLMLGMIPRLFNVQLALEELKHFVCVPETHGVAAAWLFQRGTPRRLTVTIPLAPHPEHVGEVAGFGAVSRIHVAVPSSNLVGRILADYRQEIVRRSETEIRSQKMRF
jgi:hypothetical protein